MKFNYLNQGMAALIFSASCLVSVANAGLIHSYDYNGNALDSTGSAHGTTNEVTLTTDRYGNANSAYYFNGNNSSIMSTFVNPETATYSLWATLTPDNTYGDMLFSAGTTTGPDLWNYCGNLQWNTWTGCGNEFASTPANLSDGSFHHYVVVNDKALNKASLFIDGFLIGEAAYRHKGGNVFAVGNHCAGCTDYNWQGKIDDVRVFDTALSQSDVTSLYRATEVPEPSTLAIFALGMIGLASRRFKKQS